MCRSIFGCQIGISAEITGPAAHRNKPRTSTKARRLNHQTRQLRTFERVLSGDAQHEPKVSACVRSLVHCDLELLSRARQAQSRSRVRGQQRTQTLTADAPAAGRRLRWPWAPPGTRMFRCRSTGSPTAAGAARERFRSGKRRRGGSTHLCYIFLQPARHQAASALHLLAASLKLRNRKEEQVSSPKKDTFAV